MTEAEWLAATDPTLMLEFLRGKVSARKLRLFACGSCRRIWHLLGQSHREVVEHAELIAEGKRRPFDLSVDDAQSDEDAVVLSTQSHDPFAAAGNAADWAAQSLGTEAAMQGVFPEYAPRIIAERRTQSLLLRCLIGPLAFRPLSVDPSWLTPTVVQLARGIYEERAFDRMPILADALQDAGCDNEDILSHCRGPGPHVRGCWVIDLLLGKS